MKIAYEKESNRVDAKASQGWCEPGSRRMMNRTFEA